MRGGILVMIVFCAACRSGAGPAADPQNIRPQAGSGDEILTPAGSESGQAGASEDIAPGLSRRGTQPWTRATAQVTVLRSEIFGYAEGAGPALSEIHMREAFSGEIDGQSEVRALQIRGGASSASVVSLQRFQGRLAGRAGSFVLRGSEFIEGDRIKATWSVIPGSGTGQLSGLRGTGGFEGEFGKGSQAWLDYGFD